MIIGPARRLKYKKRIRRKNQRQRHRHAKENNIQLNDTVSKIKRFNYYFKLKNN